MRTKKVTKTRTKTTTKTVLVLSSRQRLILNLFSMCTLACCFPALYYSSPFYYGMWVIGMVVGYLTIEHTIVSGE